MNIIFLDMSVFRNAILNTYTWARAYCSMVSCSALGPLATRVSARIYATEVVTCSFISTFIIMLAFT